MGLNDNEEFLTYWKANREKEKNSLRPFFIGLSAGFLVGISILVILESGWYERANMEANTKLSSVVLLISIISIALFMAFFYRKFRWEMREQRYMELIARQKKSNKSTESSLIS